MTLVSICDTVRLKHDRGKY